MQEIDEIYDDEPVNPRSAIIARYPTPDDPPWKVPAAIGVWIFSVLVILILPNLFVLPYLRSQQIPFSDSLRRSIVDPPKIFLKIEKRWRFAQTSEHGVASEHHGFGGCVSILLTTNPLAGYS